MSVIKTYKQFFKALRRLEKEVQKQKELEQMKASGLEIYTVPKDETLWIDRWKWFCKISAKKGEQYYFKEIDTNTLRRFEVKSGVRRLFVTVDGKRKRVMWYLKRLI